jgi:uncharacterized SAM-binding protein YcdF (DUF218 family)
MKNWTPALTGLAIAGIAGLLARDLGLGAMFPGKGDYALVVAVIAVVGAVVWYTRYKALVAGVAAGVAVLWALVAFTPMVGWMVERTQSVAELSDGRADAVIVLGTRVEADGSLAPESMEYVLHALELTRQGEARRILLSQPMDSPSAEEAAVRLVERLGIRARVSAFGPVGSTREEAVAAATLAQERKWERLIVVGPTQVARRFEKLVKQHEVEVAVSLPGGGVPAVATVDRPSDRLREFSRVAPEFVSQTAGKVRDRLPFGKEKAENSEENREFSAAEMTGGKT